MLCIRVAACEALEPEPTNWPSDEGLVLLSSKTRPLD